LQGGPLGLMGKMAGRVFGRGAGGGISAGPSGTLTSFRGGVSTLVQVLADRAGADLHLGAPVTSLERIATGWLVGARTSEGATRYHPADAVVLACPADAAAGLLQSAFPSLSGELAAIPYASITVVATAFARADLPEGTVDGFGFLVPDVEHRPILGVLWDSSIFPDRAPPGQVLLRAMVGGARHPDLAAMPDDAVVATVRQQIAELMGIRATPTRVRVIRWARGIPQYNVGHLDRLSRIDASLAGLPGLFLCHNSYRGISLDDCCREAMLASGRVLAHLGVPAGEGGA